MVVWSATQMQSGGVGVFILIDDSHIGISVQKDKVIMDYISMGAVGASAPMLSKVVGASIHIFFANFPLIHILSKENMGKCFRNFNKEPAYSF